MKTQKAEHGKSQKSPYDCHNDSDCCLVHIVVSPLDDENDTISDSHDGTESGESKKHHKVSYVPFADASSHKTTVVIEHIHTVLTSRAVTRPCRPVNLASLTEPFISSWLGIQQLLETIFVMLEIGSSGNDAGIGASSNDEKDGH